MQTRVKTTTNNNSKQANYLLFNRFKRYFRRYKRSLMRAQVENNQHNSAEDLGYAVNVREDFRSYTHGLLTGHFYSYSRQKQKLN